MEPQTVFATGHIRITILKHRGQMEEIYTQQQNDIVSMTLFEAK